MRIGFYEPIKNNVTAALAGDGSSAAPPAVLVKLLSGVLSGAIASGMFTPTDVVKVRMQADVTAPVAGAERPHLRATAT